MTSIRKELKVKSESYNESHTDTLDKEVYKRVLENKEGTFKLTIEQPMEFEEIFNRGNIVDVDFQDIQKKLK
jgi:hypothetical protein